MEKKKLLFSIAGCGIVASYTLVKPLKLILFSELVGPSYLPFAFLVSLGSLTVSTWCINAFIRRYSHHKTIPALITFYAIILALTGIASLYWRHQNVACLWYLIADLHTACTLNLFWYYLHQHHTRAQATKNYTGYLAWGGLGSLVTPPTIYIVKHHLLIHNNNLHLLVLVGATLLLMLSAYSMAQVHQYQLASLPANRQQTDTTSPLSNHYLYLMFGMSLLYYAITTYLDLIIAKTVSTYVSSPYITLLAITGCTYGFTTIGLMYLKNIPHQSSLLLTRLLLTPLMLIVVLITIGCFDHLYVITAGSFLCHIVYNCLGYPAQKIIIKLLHRSSVFKAEMLGSKAKIAGKGVGALLLSGMPWISFSLTQLAIGGALSSLLLILAGCYYLQAVPTNQGKSS